MSAAAALSALASADHHHVAILVQPKKLGERQFQPRRDARCDCQRGARLTALDLGEHRRAHAAAVRKIAKRELHGIAESANPGADGQGVDDRLARSAALLRGGGRHQETYVITYNRIGRHDGMIAFRPLALTPRRRCGKVARTKVTGQARPAKPLVWNAAWV